LRQGRLNFIDDDQAAAAQDFHFLIVVYRRKFLVFQKNHKTAWENADMRFVGERMKPPHFLLKGDFRFAKTGYNTYEAKRSILAMMNKTWIFHKIFNKFDS